MNIAMQWVSSLEKVFPHTGADLPVQTGISALRGEHVSLQCSCVLDNDLPFWADATLSSDFGGELRLYRVGLVPCDRPAYELSDDNFISKEKGEYPDTLLPADEPTAFTAGKRRAFWVEAVIPTDCPSGDYTVTLSLHNHYRPSEILNEASFTLTVLPATLPKQTLRYTNWFHCDCLAVYYGVQLLGKEHRQLIEAYTKHAAEYGVNMLLTPLFTPPLDTAVGAERPTVQLVDVTLENGHYHFSFDKLRWFLDMAAGYGVEYFEMSHLFTQWGAAAAPKIMATVDGVEQQLFGWDTSATSPEYLSFLQLFIKRLRTFLRKTGYEERCYFHISDEPNTDNLESYRAAREGVMEALNGVKVMDALSDFELYSQGVVSLPVPAINHIDPFLEHGMPELWTYYCCGQLTDVSNRMIAMPSARNRILGIQLYKYDVKGFLQWGYNFWFSSYSRCAVNPYDVTDSCGAFPSGDPFVVYPGKNGAPVPSLRELVFAEGLQDMRALQLLESLTSREEVLQWLEEIANGEITFRRYPKEAAWLLHFREQLNAKIAKLIK